MKIKISTTLVNSKDEVLKESDAKVLLIKDVFINSLLIPQSSDEERVKWEKYNIYKKIKAAKDIVELSVEEIVILKKAIGKTQPPLIMGQAWEVLES